jgi:hypothetical protein
MLKKIVGCLLVLGLTAGASWAGTKAEKSGAACDAQNSQACPMSTTDAKAAAPAAAVQPAAPAAQIAAQPAAAGAEASSLTVDEISVATGVENRAPVGAAETFPAATPKLYCYTKLSGGKEGDTVVHKWSHDGKVVSEVTLKVSGSPWRTFSSKTLGEDAAGAWTVDVVQNNCVLKTAKFEVTK